MKGFTWNGREESSEKQKLSYLSLSFWNCTHHKALNLPNTQHVKLTKNEGNFYLAGPWSPFCLGKPWILSN